MKTLLSILSIFTLLNSTSAIGNAEMVVSPMKGASLDLVCEGDGLNSKVLVNSHSSETSLSVGDMRIFKSQSGIVANPEFIEEEFKAQLYIGSDRGLFLRIYGENFDSHFQSDTSEKTEVTGIEATLFLGGDEYPLQCSGKIKFSPIFMEY